MDQDERQYDLFISYADADEAWVEGYLLDALDRAGARVHTEEAFALGAPRLLEFERAVQDSERTLLILSPAYLAESFAQFTDLLAQTYGLETATWPVIPLVLHEVDLPPRLAMLESLDGTDPDAWAEVVERLCGELQRPVPGPAPKPACPYPGMVPFGEADSDRFYGRDEEVEELVERLRLDPFLTVIGPSGSGKSSLVFAGLIPALRRSKLFGTGSQWQVRALRPGESPQQALAHALGGVAQPSDQRLLVVVDQFEELFTLACDDQVRPFQEMLQRLIQTPNCYVVLTARADFYPDLMATSLWGMIQAHRFEVLPLDAEGLRQAIVRPADDAGVFVETALVERLVADAGREPGVLPLVQEAMVLLWGHLERRFLPLRAYNKALVLTRRTYGEPPLTGLQVAIGRRADAALADLGPEQRVAARRIFLRLVQFGEGRADTRRQQPAADLRATSDDPDTFDQTLRHLADCRLLTLSGEQGSARRTVDIAHEALIAGWPTLQGWLAERREAEKIRRRLEGKAAEWERLGRGEGGLLDAYELQEAETWLSSPDAGELGGGSEALGALVAKSHEAIAAAEREEAAAHQRELAHLRDLTAEAEARRQSEESRAEQERRSAERERQDAGRLRKRAVFLTIAVAVALVLAIAAGAGWLATRRAEANAVIGQATAVAAEETAEAARVTAVAEGKAAEDARATAVAEGKAAEDARATAVAEKAAAETAKMTAVAAEETAEARRVEALSHALASSALLSHERGELDLALLLSAQAYRTSPTAMAKRNLYSILEQNKYLTAYLPGSCVSAGWGWRMAFNAAGTRLVAECAVFDSAPPGTYKYVLWDLGGSRQLEQPKQLDEKLSPPTEDESVQVYIDADQLNFDGRGELINWSNGYSWIGSDHDKTRLVAGMEESEDQEMLFTLWSLPEYQVLDQQVYPGDPCSASVYIVDDRLSFERSSASGYIAPYYRKMECGSSGAGLFGVLQDSIWRLPFVSPDGRIIAGFACNVGNVVIGDCLQGDVILASTLPSFRPIKISLGERWLRGLAYDREQLLWAIAQVGDNGIELLRLEDGTLVSAARLDLPASTGMRRDLFFSPESGRLAWQESDRVVVWSAQTNEMLCELDSSQVYDIALSPDGQTLATWGDSGLTLRESTGCAPASERLLSLPPSLQEKLGAGHASAGLAFSGDGQTIALGLDFSIWLWDIKKDEPSTIGLGTSPSYTINRIAISHDGSTIAVGMGPLQGEGCRTVLVDARTGTETGPFENACLPAPSPDNRTLAAVLSDEIAIWDMDPEHWVDQACRIANRNMTQTEWTQYAGDEPYHKTCPDLP